MSLSPHRQTRIDPRRRGSTFVLVLGASLLVAVIGVSSLMAARVQRRTAALTADRIQARELARAGVDHVMWSAKTDPTGLAWRVILNGGGYESRAFASGMFSVTGADPNDGDLINGKDHPVVLTSAGVYGQARYILRVTVNSDGTPQTGTWQRVVR